MVYNKRDATARRIHGFGTWTGRNLVVDYALSGDIDAYVPRVNVDSERRA